MTVVKSGRKMALEALQSHVYLSQVKSS